MKKTGKFGLLIKKLRSFAKLFTSFKVRKTIRVSQHVLQSEKLVRVASLTVTIKAGIKAVLRFSRVIDTICLVIVHHALLTKNQTWPITNFLVQRIYETFAVQVFNFTREWVWKTDKQRAESASLLFGKVNSLRLKCRQSRGYDLMQFDLLLRDYARLQITFSSVNNGASGGARK